MSGKERFERIAEALSRGYGEFLAHDAVSTAQGNGHYRKGRRSHSTASIHRTPLNEELARRASRLDALMDEYRRAAAAASGASPFLHAAVNLDLATRPYNNKVDKDYDKFVVDQNNDSIDYVGIDTPRGSSLLKRTNARLKRTTSALQLSDVYCLESTAPAAMSSASVWDLRTPRAHPSLQAVAPITAGRATMSVLESQLLASAGRFRIEIKAIMGFARLGAGDCFEVSLKHSTQRWKTRGKTLANQTQQWTPHNATLLNCIPNAPITVKVIELRFFKSKCLNERSFEAPRFFSAQPQLVTINLNSTGSLKLQLVITWLPLPLPNGGSLQSGLPTMAGLSRSMANLPTAQSASHFQHAKQISSASQIGVTHDARSHNVNSPGSSATARDVSDDECHADADDSSSSLRRSGHTEVDGSNDTSPKIFMRDKKRHRLADFHASALSVNSGDILANKDRWRHSSTMMLDTPYRDLSKSIPFIDDLAKMRTKTMNSRAHATLLQDRSYDYFTASATLPRPASDAKSAAKSPEKSVISSSKISESSASTKKNRLSSLKKSRQNSANKLSASYYAKVPMLDTVDSSASHSQLVTHPFSTICVEDAPPHTVDALRQIRRRSSAATKSPQLGSIAESDPATIGAERALKTVNALLDQIETLRRLLSKINMSSSATFDDASEGGDFTELVGFEACMLNWEAILKLNRAFILDKLRATRHGNMPPAPAGPLGYSRLSSLYPASHRQSSHSPSNASDDIEEAATSLTPLVMPMDQISENDSGIDSLRQHISPYHISNGSSRRLPPSGFSEVIRGTSKNALNEFKQNKERRKSLGALLDAIHSLRQSGGQKSPPSAAAMPIPNFDAVRAVAAARHRTLTSSVSSTSSSSESRRGSSTSTQFQSSRVNATGSAEVDDCLAHHFGLAISSLQRINAIRSTPFEYTLSELLARLEQDTIALELLRRVVAQLPALPNIGMLCYDLGASGELREIWTGAASVARTMLIVPLEALRNRLQQFVQPIVAARRYSTLINNVIDSLMRFLCNGRGDEAPAKVTLFQFLAFFGGTDLAVFVENVSHEAWITVNLNSSDPQKISEVMDRLRKVPVVPPLESLRHVALVLASANDAVNGNALRAPIERYLNSSSVSLAGDLTASFMCILEHDDESSRVGACLALGILTQENALSHLQYLAANDSSARVKTIARQAANEIKHNFRPSPLSHKYLSERQRMNESRMNGNSAVEVTKI